MTTETILDTEHITMWYHQDTKIIHHQIHKYIHGEVFRGALEVGVEQLKKNRACKWLSDDQSYGALPQEDVKWGLEYWGPKAAKAGWRFWAIVMPKSVLGKISIEHFIDAYGKLGVTVKAFSDVNEGMAWLKKQRVDSAE